MSIYASLNEAKRFLLWNCVNTYLTLTTEQQKEYETLLAKEPKGVNTMELTYADQLEARGEARGKQAGIAEGKAETLVEVIEARGLKLTKEEKEKILTCQDLTQLKAWVAQVSSIKKASELFAPPKPTKKTATKKKH